MALVGPASFLPTADEFIAHWHLANAALGAAGPITLGPGAVGVESLADLRTLLYQRREEVAEARITRELTRARIEHLKAALLDRLNQFNGKLRSWLDPRSVWLVALPKAYSITDGMGGVIGALQEVEDLWTLVTAAEGAFVLRDGYSLAGFAAELAALTAAYRAVTAADKEVRRARARRTLVEEEIHALLKAYRAVIPSDFAPRDPIAVTLPRLTPKPGRTPDAAVLAAAFNPATGAAELSWTPPDDAAVVAFELRACIGPEFDREDEVSLESFPADAPPSFSTDYGLTHPGTAVSYKLYARTALGHERGSNAVTVVREAG